MSEQIQPRLRRVAFPTDGPAGLAAGISPHFGHCQYFTVVELVDDAVRGTLIVENLRTGNCADSVNSLTRQQVRTVVVRGIGQRPLVAFQAAGVEAFSCPARTIGEGVEALVAGELHPVEPGAVCTHTE